MKSLWSKPFSIGILLLISISFSTSFTGCAAAEETYGPAYEVTFASDRPALSDLLNIQEKIYNAFVQSMVQEKYEPLGELAQKLDELAAANPQNLVIYWKSYLSYYTAIYYSQVGDKAKSEKEIMSTVEQLEDMEGKNAEDYALLCMAKSYSIQFLSSFKAAIASGKVKDYGKKALSIDPQNLRAYYVLGSNDYYTPEQYGGGKKVEEYLLKALEQPDQAVENPYLPSWGREETYEMLIKFYIKKENWDKAKAKHDEATERFPDSYQIAMLESELEG